MLVDKKFFELLLEEFVNANTDDEGRWITIKPHGDDSEDYRRLKLRKGESPKEAIDRVYKKEDKAHKEKVKELDNIEIRTKDGIKKVSFADISLSDEYLKKNKKHSEVWDSKIQAMVKNPYYNKEKDIKKQLKKEKIEELAKSYKRNPDVTPHEEFIKRQKSLNLSKYD